MKVKDYIEVCSYTDLYLTVCYECEEDITGVEENLGKVCTQTALLEYGDYDILELHHVSRLETVRTENKEFVSALMVSPRLWVNVKN